MTELYIDGFSAVLPKDFNVQVKRENPLFTKNGEYTYDITLPLGNPVNAELYKHLNRLNSVEEIKSKRSAILVADNRVYCNGTEIITGWTDDTVSIQIASGNSELNYIIGNDLQITSLDGMPETTEITEAAAHEHVEKKYPDVEYCLPMVYDRDSEEILNPWFINGYQSESEYTSVLTPGDYFQHSLPPVEADVSRFYPQPYLCVYLQYLFNALGYTLSENFLTGTVYKDLFICHAVRTLKWAEMLPGWSVGDFLEQLERMFDGVFVVDNRNRNVRFLSRHTYYHASTTSHVRWVEDIYEVETADEDDEPEAVNIMLSNVRYDFPDNAYWRGRCLPDSVKAAARRGGINIVAIPDNSFDKRMDAWFSDTSRQRTDTIYIDYATQRKVFYNVDHEVEGSPKDHWQLVDEFAAIERDNPEQEVELKIMPAELAQVVKEICFRDFYGYTAVVTRFPMPAIDGGSGSSEDEEDAEDEETSTPVADLINNSSAESSDSSSSQNNICLAFYAGLTLHVKADYNDTPLPLAYTDEWVYVWATNTYMQTNQEGKTLRLTDLQDNLWEGAMEIDQRNEIKLTSHDPNLYDTRGVFEIRNKRYVCKEIEYTIDANGRKGAWIGTFYAAKISDTEADARWILADGKWRDGGVWLDNGRWLDQ